MNMKKFMALVVALVMALSMITVTTNAADTPSVLVKTSTSVYEGTEFTLDVVLTPSDAALNLKSFQFDFTYDTTKVELLHDEYMLPKFTIPYVGGQLAASVGNVDTATGACSFGYNCSAAFNTNGLPLPADGLMVSISFKAKEGDAAVGQFITAISEIIYNDKNDSQGRLTTGGVTNTTTIADLAVQEIPEAPSVDVTGGISGTLKAGQTVTANYTFNNGAMVNNPADDASEIVWYVGETKFKEATADEDKTLILTDAMVGKTIKYEVTPKVDRAEALNPVGTKQPSAVSAIVMPADTYAPTATVSLEKVTIGKEVELNYTVNTYEVGEEAPTFAWYVMSEEDAKKVLEAKDIAAAEKATAMEGDAFTKANPTFEKTIGEGESEMELKGMWAVVKVTAKETVAEASYPLEGTEPNVYYAAAEIKAKKTGGTTQTGASLVTGGNTVVTPEKPVDPETPVEPEKPVDPENPGTEEPAGSEDPAGTANENGAAAFTDVNKEAYAWAYDSIDVLAKAGVIKGMSETTFGPELTTTNAQVIALAVRIAGLTAEEGATTDKVDAEHWVAGEMAIADANEILGVYGDKVDVEGETTREIAFTLLYNALKAAGVELEETAEAIEFTDAASISEGCAEAIDALVKAGIVNGMGDGTLAPKATLTRAQLAKILGLANALIK